MSSFSSALLPRLPQAGMLPNILAVFFAALLFVSGGFPALAFAAEPTPWQIGFQDPATELTDELAGFHSLLTWIITGIVIFVLGLLLFVMIRFNEKSNPVPSRTTHNVLIEVIWTVVPLIVLIVIAIPSFRILYYSDRTPPPDMTLEVMGYQWGWTYTYPDQGGISFNADMIEDDQLDEYIPDQDGRRLLETYNPVVLPIGKTIEFIITAGPNDVLHSWAVPSFGIKRDAVPGRIQTAWTKIKEAGIYYGQCSELCGDRHAYMPISIYAVGEKEFDSWISCMEGDGAEALFPSRQCVRDLGLDKYRRSLKDVNTLRFSRATRVEKEKTEGSSESKESQGEFAPESNL